jgi:hypothetical protein
MRHLALAAVLLTGCAGNLSLNNKNGLAVVGGATVIAGITVAVDGLSCDQANWDRGTCQRDGGELATGSALIVGGGALLTWAILQIAGDDEAAPAPSTRTAATRSSKAAPLR